MNPVDFIKKNPIKTGVAVLGGVVGFMLIAGKNNTAVPVDGYTVVNSSGDPAAQLASDTQINLARIAASTSAMQSNNQTKVALETLTTQKALGLATLTNADAKDARAVAAARELSLYDMATRRYLGDKQLDIDSKQADYNYGVTGRTINVQAALIKRSMDDSFLDQIGQFAGIASSFAGGFGSLNSLSSIFGPARDSVVRLPQVLNA